MSLALRVTPFARDDLREIIDYYEGQRPGLGLEFYEDAEKQMLLATRQPLRHAPYAAGTRGIRLTRWRHVIAYRTTARELQVFGLFHPARDPDWIARALRRRTR